MSVSLTGLTKSLGCFVKYQICFKKCDDSLLRNCALHVHFRFCERNESSPMSEDRDQFYCLKLCLSKYFTAYANLHAAYVYAVSKNIITKILVCSKVTYTKYLEPNLSIYVCFLTTRDFKTVVLVHSIKLNDTFTRFFPELGDFTF